MKRIRLLEKQVSELIAAGEVVERPASAVKELLENAVDAGATLITLEIKNGGITFIRVTDNGAGILREDVPTAFLRHATSKIGAASDLDAIGTLGFRGEALASIAAVSKVELLTRTENELSGTRIMLSGGEIIETGDAGCPRGTTIIIRELFFNTPARMKFLKKDVTEANAITAVAERIALSHPEISIRYLKDGREEFHTPGDNQLISAVHATLGRAMAVNLISTDYELEGVKVSGYVLKPIAARPNRNMQFFFLNGRLIKSKTAMAALEEAYKGSIMVGKYPGCVLHISLNPALVDVNVHPAKIEVRFSNEKQIFETVYYAVKNAVVKEDTRPAFHLSQAPLKQPGQTEIPGAVFKEKSHPAQVGMPGFTRGAREMGDAGGVVMNTPRAVYQPVQRKDDSGITVLPKQEVPVQKTEPLRIIGEKSGKIQIEPIEVKNDSKKAEDVDEPFRVVGQCFDTYIIVEKGSELMLIDKHAAHERILYEELKSRRQPVAQQLLTPRTATLAREEYLAVTQHADLLKNTGFDLEDFGGATVLVRSAPIYLDEGEIESTVVEIAGYLAAHKKELIPQKLEWLFHSIACRAAVKGGDKTGQEEANRLVSRVLQDDNIRYCPHGRPVAMTLTRSEIEKQFGRI